MLARDSGFYQWYWFHKSPILGLLITCVVPRQMPVVSESMRAESAGDWNRRRRLQDKLQSYPIVLQYFLLPFYALLGIFQAYRNVPEDQRHVLLRIAHIFFGMIGFFTNFLVHVVNLLLFPISFLIFLYTRKEQLSLTDKISAFIVYAIIIALIVITATGFGATASKGLHAFARVLGTPFVALFQLLAQNLAIRLSVLSIFAFGVMASLIVFGWQRWVKGQGIDAALLKIEESIVFSAGTPITPKLKHSNSNNVPGFPNTKKVVSNQKGLLTEEGRVLLKLLEQYLKACPNEFTLSQRNQALKFIKKYMREVTMPGKQPTLSHIPMSTGKHMGQLGQRVYEEKQAEMEKSIGGVSATAPGNDNLTSPLIDDLNKKDMNYDYGSMYSKTPIISTDPSMSPLPETKETESVYAITTLKG